MTRAGPTAQTQAGRDVLARWTTSRANYWIGFGLDGSIAIALLTVGWVAAASPLAAVAAMVIGYAFYTVHEYVCHRWLYHASPGTAQRMHGLHHTAPRAEYGAPFLFTLVQCAAGWGLASLIVGGAVGAVFAGAVLLSHTCQGALHHAMHQSRARGTGAFARLRRHHLIHHKRADVNFGVLCTLWDRLLGTRADTAAGPPERR